MSCPGLVTLKGKKREFLRQVDFKVNFVRLRGTPLRPSLPLPQKNMLSRPGGFCDINPLEGMSLD